MISLIGVWHAFQLVGYSCLDWNHWINVEYGLTGPDVWKPFYEFLSAEAERIDADLLAEEMSEEGIACHMKHGARDSIARRVASEQLRKHLFIDPEREERERLGITREQIQREKYGAACLTEEQSKEITQLEHARREECWIRSLQSTSFHHCICIVGSNHISTFPSLLSTNKIKHSILVADFTPKWFTSRSSFSPRP